jgi:hypothetical protein
MGSYGGSSIGFTIVNANFFDNIVQANLSND